MVKTLAVIAMITAGLAAGGCGGPTTGAEIERIMSEARSDAAKRLAQDRRQQGGIPASVDEFRGGAQPRPAEIRR